MTYIVDTLWQSTTLPRASHVISAITCHSVIGCD